MTVRGVRARAYAKLNLCLEVLGRRPDGFHEIASVVQLVSLHDTIECHASESLSVDCSPEVGVPDENLATRAASALASTVGRSPGARVSITKRIPAAAGLGGGSSDAATTLRLLNVLWRQGLDSPALSRIGAGLGSDIPLFLRGGAAWIGGRGERVRRIRPLADTPIVIACPEVAIPSKTARMYAALRPSDWTTGDMAMALSEQLDAGRAPDSALLFNVFDRAADVVYDGFAAIRERLVDGTGRRFHLTGAGPSLFALAADGADARRVATAIQHLNIPAHVVLPVAGPGRIVRMSDREPAKVDTAEPTDVQVPRRSRTLGPLLDVSHLYFVTGSRRSAIRAVDALQSSGVTRWIIIRDGRTSHGARPRAVGAIGARGGSMLIEIEEWVATRAVGSLDAASHTIHVSRREAIAAHRLLADEEGIQTSIAAAGALAGLTKLRRVGRVRNDVGVIIVLPEGRASAPRPAVEGVP